MPAFLVCYDLTDTETDADQQRLWARLREWRAKQVLYTAWLIAGDMTARAIYDDLVRYVDPNDRLVVLAVTGEAVWGSRRLLMPDQEAIDLLEG